MCVSFLYIDEFPLFVPFEFDMLHIEFAAEVERNTQKNIYVHVYLCHYPLIQSTQPKLKRALPYTRDKKLNDMFY